MAIFSRMPPNYRLITCGPTRQSCRQNKQEQVQKKQTRLAYANDTGIYGALRAYTCICGAH